MQTELPSTDGGGASLVDEFRALQIINETGALIASQLDLEKAVRAVVDAGVELTGAEF